LGDVESRRAAVLKAAQELLESGEVSYVYGGSRIGEEGQCTACNTCLETKAPKPKRRLSECPECAACSLDCSHFTNLVYRHAGLNGPYLTTKAMISTSTA